MVVFHAAFDSQDIGVAGGFSWSTRSATCPECHKAIMYLERFRMRGDLRQSREGSRQVYPTVGRRPNCPPEVPDAINEDYDEAVRILEISPKASAALSRRCLHNVLLERGLSNESDLDAAINDALHNHLPDYLHADLDAIREVADFSGQPEKAAHAAEIHPVEPEEAGWNLEVLDLLFDHLYVQPAKSASHREALQQRLRETRKGRLRSL